MLILVVVMVLAGREIVMSFCLAAAQPADANDDAPHQQDVAPAIRSTETVKLSDELVNMLLS
jgi:hypothetical protein